MWHKLNSKKNAGTEAKILYRGAPTIFYSRTTFNVNITKNEKFPKV